MAEGVTTNLTTDAVTQNRTFHAVNSGVSMLTKYASPHGGHTPPCEGMLHAIPSIPHGH